MRRLLALITAMVLFGLIAVPAFASGNNGETCDKVYPSYEKVDRSSGHVSENWGSIKWSGKTLDYDVEKNWTLMLCIKSGTKVGIVHFELSGSDTIKIEQDISHIAYKAVKDEEPPPTTVPPKGGELSCPGNVGIVKTVIRDEPGSKHVLLYVVVTEESQGLEAKITAQAENNSSVHPGNDLIITSNGGGSVVLADVERAPGAVTPANGELTLGAGLTVTLVMGQDGVFSGGMMLSAECPEEPTTTTTIPETTTTTVPESTTTTVPETTSTTTPEPEPEPEPITATAGGSCELVFAETNGPATVYLSYTAEGRDEITATEIISAAGGSSVELLVQESDLNRDLTWSVLVETVDGKSIEFSGSEECSEPTPTTTPPTTAPPTTTPPSTLPRTGTEYDGVAIIALIALLSGSALAFLARKSQEA